MTTDGRKQNNTAPYTMCMRASNKLIHRRCIRLETLGGNVCKALASSWEWYTAFVFGRRAVTLFFMLDAITRRIITSRLVLVLKVNPRKFSCLMGLVYHKSVTQLINGNRLNRCGVWESNALCTPCCIEAFVYTNYSEINSFATNFTFIGAEVRQQSPTRTHQEMR